MEVTIESMCQRWRSSERPLFKGALIDSEGCCCAQGDVLRCSGFEDRQIRETNQMAADKAVAKILGISTTHSILLRQQNDKSDGCPQDVLSAPEKILGSEAQRILAFWKRLDAMKPKRWNTAWTAARDAAGNAAWNAAGTAAGNTAWNAARNAAGTAARNTAWTAAGTAAWTAAGATAEIQGHSKLASLFFLPLFGINKIEDLDEPEV